jgi:hypothetical protein
MYQTKLIYQIDGVGLGGAYYWLDEVPLAGMFFIRGAAPPSSRKLTETPVMPPSLVERRAPVK